MSRPAPRTLHVIRSQRLSPHMLRITLGGKELANFPQNQQGAYIKLLFPQDDGVKPLMRTYTVIDQRSDEIDVDFVLHNTAGPASTWAEQAQAGDAILVGGPGPKKIINRVADWFLLAGDMTALPAITVNLAELPADARGYAVIEVVDESDIQSLQAPENVALHWVVNNTITGEASPLPNYVEQLAWLPGQPAVWAACEFQSMRALRKYFKVQRQVAKTHLYVSSYWKYGSTEDQHKIVKRRDAETMAL